MTRLRDSCGVPICGHRGHRYRLSPTCEAASIEQRLNARVGTERIHLRIHQEKDEVHVTRGVGLLEPCERTIDVAEAGIDAGDFIGRHGTSGLLELTQQLPRL